MFEQVSEIAEKKISSSIENDLKRSDKFSFRTESEKDFSLLHIGNSLKGLVKEKKMELVVLIKRKNRSRRNHFSKFSW